MLKYTTLPQTLIQGFYQAFLCNYNIIISFTNPITYLIELYDVRVIEQLHDLNLPVDFLQVGRVQSCFINYFNCNLHGNAIKCTLLMQNIYLFIYYSF